MTSPQRLFVDQLTAWITDEVEDTEGWAIRKEEPRDWSGGQELAVWWLGDEPFDQDSTTGWLGLVDLYAVRYTEPADDAARVASDEAAGDVLSETLQQVRAAIVKHRGLPAGQLANASEMAYSGSRKLGDEDNASGVRGFQVLVRVRRPEQY